MKAQWVVDALWMAVWQRKPKDGLIMHTDRGSQYASHQYRSLLSAHGIKSSMSRKVITGIMQWQKASTEALNKSVCIGKNTKHALKRNRTF
jgi:hypothetical protein